MGSNIKKRIITSIFLISLLTLMFFYSYIMIISVIIISIIAWIEFYALISKIFKKNEAKHKVLRFLYKAISLLFLSILVYLIFIIELDNLNLKIYLLYSVLVAIMSDIGGLVFGKIFKGKKLTKISPNKTISGSIGSLFLTSIVISSCFFYFTENFNYTIVIVSIVTSLACQFGDLFFSYLKRKAKVKDTSNLLPGHGGLLDRVDGIIFAVPAGISLLNFLN